MIDAIFKIKSEPSFNINQITHISVEAFFEASKIPNNPSPHSIEDAQFSMPFTAAVALLHGKSAFRPLMSDSLSNAKILALSKQIKLSFPTKFEGKFPIKTPTCVTIQGKDWQLSNYVESPLGDVNNPLSTKEIKQKLFDLGASYLPKSLLDELVISVLELKRKNSNTLYSLLT